MLFELVEKVTGKKEASEVKEAKVNEETIDYIDQFVTEILPEQGSAMVLSMFGFFTKYPIVKSEKELGEDLANKIKKFDKEKMTAMVEKVELSESEGIQILTLHAHYKDGKNDLKLKYTISQGNMKVDEE